VDGVSAPLIRANGLFRAVHLASGEHTVAFDYRPRTLMVGAAVSGVTALALALWCVSDRSRRRDLSGAARAA
jgi:hypothetical protein